MNRPEYELMYAREETDWWYVGRRNMARSLIERQVWPESNALILDVGCGTGGNLTTLAPYGSVIGVDLSVVALDLARQHRSVYCLAQASALGLPFTDNTFDLITSFDILYHRWVTDDSQALSELYRLVRPGGRLLLTDSALPLLWSSHDQRYFARQRYTLPDMRRKLQAAGFEIRLCSYANTLLLPIFLLLRLTMDWLPATFKLHQWQTPGWLNEGLIGLRDLETDWLLRGHTLPLGSSLVCLCVKPNPTTSSPLENEPFPKGRPL